MAKDSQALLLRELCAGRTSRNRDFERFAGGSDRCALRGYRRVRSLLRELRTPGVEARVRLSRVSGEAAVEIVLRGLRYHRAVLLSQAEFAFLVAELGAVTPLPEASRAAGPPGLPFFPEVPKTRKRSAPRPTKPEG